MACLLDGVARKLLAGFCRSGGSCSFENGVRSVAARHKDGESDGGAGEEDCRPGRKACEQVGRAARPKGGLRSLATESTGEVRALALLQQDYANQEERDDDVQQDYET
jgi:hypothetical protein